MTDLRPRGSVSAIDTGPRRGSSSVTSAGPQLGLLPLVLVGAVILTWLFSWAAAAMLLGLAGFVVIKSARRFVAHPTLSLLPYLFFVFFIPPVAIWSGEVDYTTRFGAAITGTSFWVPLLMAAGGFYLGLRLGAGRSWLAPPDRSMGEWMSSISADRASMMRDIARLLIVVMSIYRLTFIQKFGTFSFSALGARESSDRASVEAMISIVAPAVIVLITLATIVLTKGRKTMSTPDALLVTAFIGISLLIGSRAELVPLLAIPLLMTDRFVRRVPIIKVGALGIAVLLLFSVVAELRLGRDASGALDAPLVEVITEPVKSPALILADGIGASDTSGELEYGRTYRDSVLFFLPSVVSSRLVGSVEGSGARALRDSLSYTGTSGLGYSFPLEWYVNFGLAGMLLGGVVFGLALGRAYALFVAGTSFVAIVMWPVIVARLAITARSDFLASMNGFLYVVALSFAAYLVAGMGKRSRRP